MGKAKASKPRVVAARSSKKLRDDKGVSFRVKAVERARLAADIATSTRRAASVPGGTSLGAWAKAASFRFARYLRMDQSIGALIDQIGEWRGQIGFRLEELGVEPGGDGDEHTYERIAASSKLDVLKELDDKLHAIVEAP